MRRWVVVSSLGVLGFAPCAQADFRDWRVYPGGPVWVHETASAASGPGLFDRCYAIAVTDFVTANNTGEVWCVPPTGGSFEQLTSISTAGFASVALDAAPDVSGGFAPPRFAVTDPDLGQIWYGVAGGTPELAVQ